MIRMRKQGSLLNIPLLIALLATFVSVFIAEGSILHDTGGVFMYPLDDPFIHMQVAKNLAFHNTWGINPQEFASASSSILYTLVLAGIFKLFSANVLVPFIINCIAAVFLLAAVDKWLQKQELTVTARTVILLLLVVFTPLPVLIISGMEHTLQCLFSFLFVVKFSGWLEEMKNGDPGKGWKLPFPLLLYGILVVAVRYEGLFLVAIACLLLLYYRRPRPAFQLGLIALLPVIVFGICSLALGSYFLPNSVLVKSEEIPLSLKGMANFLNNILISKLTVVKSQVKAPGVPPPGISLLVTQRLLLILPLTWLFFREQISQRRAYTYILFILTAVTVLHLSFAATGWLYRYEAYLVLCSLAIVSVIIYRVGKQVLQERSGYTRWFTLVLLFALCFPFLLRSAAACSNIKQACINIYQQQYQMAQFLEKYYDHDTIAANDIGAVSYYSKINTVDLWGLGSIEVARSKKGRYWTPVFLDSLVKKRQVRLAVIYDEWFDPALLAHWTKVAEWQVGNNVILGGDTVSFYVINKKDGADLAGKLRDYQQHLPPGVTVVYK